MGAKQAALRTRAGRAPANINVGDALENVIEDGEGAPGGAPGLALQAPPTAPQYVRVKSLTCDFSDPLEKTRASDDSGLPMQNTFIHFSDQDSCLTPPTNSISSAPGGMLRGPFQLKTENDGFHERRGSEALIEINEAAPSEAVAVGLEGLTAGTVTYVTKVKARSVEKRKSETS